MQTTCPFSIRCASHSLRDGLELGVSEPRVRFQIRAFGPFVPRVDEDGLRRGLLARLGDRCF